MPKIHTDRIDVLTLFKYVLLICYVVNAHIQGLIYVIQTSQIVIRLSIIIQNNWTRMECMGTRDIIIATDTPVLGGGGNSAYERGGDACRLVYGCKFRVLVSLRVFWANRHHI